MSTYSNLHPKYKSLTQSAIGYGLSLCAVFLCVFFAITSTSYNELLTLFVMIVVAQSITYLIVKYEIKLTFHMVEIPFWMGVIITFYGAYILHEYRGIAFFCLLWGFTFLQGFASFRYMITASTFCVLAYVAGVWLLSFFNLEPVTLGQDIFIAFVLYIILILLSVTGYRILKQKEKIRRAQLEITHINKVAQAVNSTLDLDEVMKAVMGSLQEIFQFDQIGIALIDEGKKEMKFHRLYGDGYTLNQIRRLQQLRMSLSEKSYLVNLIDNNRPSYISTITSELLEKYEPREREIYEIAPHKAALVYPLEIHGKIIGLIAFNNTTESFNMDSRDIARIQRYIIQIATAINNAHIAEKIREKQRKMEELASKLGKYLSPQVYDSLFSGKIDARIITTRKKLTVFFSDIEGYSSKFEKTNLTLLTSWLNNYLDDMAKIAIRYDGTLDKFIGDAVMVFFGDPQSSGEELDAIKCVMMAMEMRENSKKSGVSIRMGINSGECIVGNFGSNVRMDYTIIGGTVNLADRLQANSETGKILIGEATYHLVKEQILCEPHGEIKVKGIDTPVMTYWVLDYKEHFRERKKLHAQVS